MFDKLNAAAKQRIAAVRQYKTGSYGTNKITEDELIEQMNHLSSDFMDSGIIELCDLAAIDVGDLTVNDYAEWLESIKTKQTEINDHLKANLEGINDVNDTTCNCPNCIKVDEKTSSDTDEVPSVEGFQEYMINELGLTPESEEYKKYSKLSEKTIPLINSLVGLASKEPDTDSNETDGTSFTDMIDNLNNTEEKVSDNVDESQLDGLEKALKETFGDQVHVMQPDEPLPKGLEDALSELAGKLGGEFKVLKLKK